MAFGDFVGHIDKWLLLSESETDFALLFVKAWIPFNAWYCNNYRSTNDRECIDKIKTDNNQLRAKLIAIIGSQESESINFKNHFEQLHRILENHPIPDATVDARITFKNICFRTNPLTATVPPVRKRHNEYKAEKLSNGAVTAIITNSRRVPVSTIYSYSYNKYDLQHFENDLLLSSTNIEQKEIIRTCFKGINPKLKENLISDKPKNSIRIGNTYFINNADYISQALIEVLYLLRCKLFHGEIHPSKDNFSAYEPCYHILRILLKSLR